MGTYRQVLGMYPVGTLIKSNARTIGIRMSPNSQDIFATWSSGRACPAGKLRARLTGICWSHFDMMGILDTLEAYESSSPIRIGMVLVPPLAMMAES